MCNKSSFVCHNGRQYFLPDYLTAWAKKHSKDTRLAALFSPEHGLLGTHQAAAPVTSEKTTPWGCPLFSLHGSTKKPTQQMLEDLDVILVDLPDVGTRCFTYLSTLKLILEAAAVGDIPVIVFDRPNPLAFWGAQGPDLEDNCASFIGAIKTPFLHGTTIGKLAKKLNKTIKAELTVVPCDDGSNSSFDHPFTPPSPNLRSMDHIFAYPITVFIEGTNYSEGRGTLFPFLQIGAPWVNAKQLARHLNNKKLPGAYFQPISFTPKAMPGIADSPKHMNKRCHGVWVHLVERKRVQPIKTARAILESLFSLYPSQSQCIKLGNRYGLDLLAGTATWRKKLTNNKQ